MPIKNPNAKAVPGQIIYESGGDKISQWHQKDRATRRILVGAYGVGKTFIVAYEVLYQLLRGKYQGKTALFMARDHSQAVHNILNKIIKPMLAGDKDKDIPGFPKGSYKVTYTAPAIIEFHNKSRIVFLSHNTDGIDGWNASIVVLDEANKASEDLYLTLENRIGREGMPGMYIMAANPTHKGHWLYTRFWKEFEETGAFPEDSHGISLSIFDSKHVTPQRIKTMEQAYKHNSALRERAIMGNFSDNSGQVYSHFDADKHILSVSQQPIIYGNEKMRITCGLDFGYKDPTAFLMVAFDPDSGRYYVFKEYQKGGSLIKDHANEISRLTNEFKKRPTIYSEHDSQTRSEYASLGVNTTLATKDLLPGINAIATLFAEDRLYIFQNCKNLKREIESYQWNDKSKKDVPVDKDNHCLDALRYAIYSVNHAGSTRLYLPGEPTVKDVTELKFFNGFNMKGEPMYYTVPLQTNKS